MFTRFGQIVGTLEYMSPEQSMMNQLTWIRGAMFTLGRVALRVIVGDDSDGSASLEGCDVGRMLRILREVDPPSPSVRLSATEAVASVAARP